MAPNFLDRAACSRIRAAMDRGAAEPADVLESGAARDPGGRRAASIDIDSATLKTVEATLDAARDAIAEYYHLPLARREGPGFLRYGPGGFYGRHRDRAVDVAWPGAERRLVSLIVFLNSSRASRSAGEFSGGELLIFPEPDVPEPDDDAGSRAIEVAPLRGSLVAFHAATLHEVRPVTSGIRDVIVDWYYEPGG